MMDVLTVMYYAIINSISVLLILMVMVYIFKYVRLFFRQILPKNDC
jgi:hypothetical protein